MSPEERINQLVDNQESLFWIADFLSEHQDADLYLVGGAVRDGLLGRQMRAVDFDLVVRGLEPSKIETWFKAFGRLNLVGKHFGVYKFLPTGFSSQDIELIDIALPRTEVASNGALGGYKDFDIQSNTQLPIEDDLARRDLTINAMAYDLRRRTLIDPFNGQVDLEDRRIRTVGDPQERFWEDLSRMLRAIRFAAELHFEIQDATSKSIIGGIAAINRLRTEDNHTTYVVPRETIGAELAKMLSRSPVRALRELLRHQALHTLFPAVARIVEVNQRYLDPLMEVRAGEPNIVAALLLRGLGRGAINEALRFTGLGTLPRKRVERIDAQRVYWLIERLQEGLTAKEVSSLPASQFERLFMNGKGPQLNRCLELVGKGDVAGAARDRRRDIEHRWLVDEDEKIAALVAGSDVLALDIKPGPRVRLLLDDIRDKQLDGHLMTREVALAELRRIVG